MEDEYNNGYNVSICWPVPSSLVYSDGLQCKYMMLASPFLPVLCEVISNTPSPYTVPACMVIMCSSFLWLSDYDTP